MERRYLSAGQAPVDVSTRSDGKQVISGYSAVFYKHGDDATQYRLWDGCVERIAEGAFDRAIRERHDVRALFNHDPDNLLGRSSNGTCKYSVDKIGLRYEIIYDANDPDHQRVASKIARGDLTGSSFAFRPVATRWEEKAGEDCVRWIEDLMLYDVGPVTYPAYDATTVGLRNEDGRELVEREYDLWSEGRIDFAVLRREVADSEQLTRRRKLQLLTWEQEELDALTDPMVVRHRQLDRLIADWC